MLKVTRTPALLACLALAACGGGGEGSGGAAEVETQAETRTEAKTNTGDKTFEGDGYSFSYPGEWIDYTETGTVSPGHDSPDIMLGPERVEPDLLSVTVVHGGPLVTEDNIADSQAFYAGEFRSVYDEVIQGPVRTTVDQLPALRTVASDTTDGFPTTHWSTLIFDETTVYSVECQFTPDGATEMRSGCDQVLESFQIE